MTKWEYLKVHVWYQNIFFSDKVLSITENGETILRDVKNVDLINYLSELGKDGWELVAVQNLDLVGKEHYGEAYFFKRPIKK